jgi:hypothetical protein
MIDVEMVSETLGFRPQLTWPVAREEFIEFSRCESFKSYDLVSTVYLLADLPFERDLYPLCLDVRWLLLSVHRAFVLYKWKVINLYSVLFAACEFACNRLFASVSKCKEK